jgi:hypothetical protein
MKYPQKVSTIWGYFYGKKSQKQLEKITKKIINF